MKAEGRRQKADGATVIIALGSNLGAARHNIERAIEHLRGLSDQPLLKSSLWETTPVDCPPGSPKFVNAVVGFEPRADETPESLLAKLQAIEKQFGRRPRKVVNEPRVLDLDLIVFGSQKRNSPDLVLPHPRANQRRFVLQPLGEIAPNVILPGQTKTVAALLKELPGAQTAGKLS